MADLSAFVAALCVLSLGASVTALFVSALRRHARSNGIPGPLFYIPLIGEIIDFSACPIKFYFKRFVRYKSAIYRVHLFGREMIVVGDREEEKKGVITNEDNVRSFIPIKSLNELVDFSNLAVPERHKIFRRHIAAALTPANIRLRLPMFEQEVKKQVSSWVAHEGPVEMDTKMKKLAVYLALGPIAGFSLSELISNQLLGLALVVQRGLFSLPIDLPGFDWNKAKRARPEYLQLLRSVVESRFEVELGVVKAPGSNSDGSIDTTIALIREFIDAQDPPTVDKLSERLVQNLLGASETTAGLMLSAMVALATVPGVMDKLRAEQSDVMATHGDALDYDTLQTKMPYLDACIRETGRLLPSAHGAFRKVKRDIEVGEYTVTKGSVLLIGFDLWSCLDPATWDGSTTGTHPPAMNSGHPETCFKPERWLDESTRPRAIHVFSFGAHTCLGMNLAILELKMILATLVRQSTWEVLNKDQRIIFVPFTKMAGGKPAMMRFSGIALK